MGRLFEYHSVKISTSHKARSSGKSLMPKPLILFPKWCSWMALGKPFIVEPDPLLDGVQDSPSTNSALYAH